VAEDVAGTLLRAVLKASEVSAKEMAQQWRDSETERGGHRSAARVKILIPSSPWGRVDPRTGSSSTSG
jgi:hypothetical protein